MNVSAQNRGDSVCVSNLEQFLKVNKDMRGGGNAG